MDTATDNGAKASPLRGEGAVAVAEAAPIPEGWLSIHEAAEELGKAPKTIESMVTEGRIVSKLIPRRGRKPERVYEARDVERLKATAAEVAKRRRDRPTEPAVPKNTVLGLAPEVVALLREILAAPKALPAAEEKLWLTLDEAAEYSGLARSDLAQLARDSQLTARKSGGWRIRRASLEAFEG